MNDATPITIAQNRAVLDALPFGDTQDFDDARRGFDWVFSDLGRRYALNLDNCALTYLADRRSDRADATVTLERAVLTRLVLQELALSDALGKGLVTIDGDASAVADLFGLLDEFTLMFEVIEPKRTA